MPEIGAHDRTCVVEVAQREVDAGAEVTVGVRAACPHGCDLREHRVSLRSQDDIELAGALLTDRAGEAYVAGPLTLQAPLDVGEHTCRVVLEAAERDGVVHEEISTEFSFVARAHAASVSAWGVPSALAPGERFRFAVGVKCSAACRLAGTPLDILDHDGAPAGAARLAEEVWPGTSALYFAEVDAVAPGAPGDYTWQATASGSDSGVPHAAGSCTFAVRVVRPPDHEVTVEAVDGATRAPIEGAHVLAHPYRAFIDKRGVAKIKVAGGRYTLVVSGFKYIAYRSTVDVAGDVTTRVELAAEPEGQEDYR